MNPTTQRVTMHTDEAINARISREIDKRVAYYREHREQIDRRLAELDQEWDIERLIEVQAPTVSLLGLVLGLLGRPRWLLVPLLVQSMMFMHAVQGWYPLLPVLRRLGVRTEHEIARERYALKALRGDFADVSPERPEDALAAFRE